MENKLLRVRVPASSANIGTGFDILGLALNLYNTVDIRKSDDGLNISYTGSGGSVIPLDEGNLVYRAILRVFDKLNEPYIPLHIDIKNDIPLMGGLGSSSSAIVSGIYSANSLLGNRLSRDEMLTLAVDLDGHPDNVTPALFGGFTFSYRDTDNNPKVIALRFPSVDIVAVSPKYHVSTNKAREVMPLIYPIGVIIKSQTCLFRLIRALEAGDLSNLASLLDDSIHQPYRFPLVPGLRKAYNMAYENGALGVFISGSGPTLVALVNKDRERIANSMVNTFKAEGLKAIYRFLEVDFEGAKVITI